MALRISILSGKRGYLGLGEGDKYLLSILTVFELCGEIALNILFWNVNKKDNDKIVECILSMIAENNVDLLVLAEYGENIQTLCNLANIASKSQYKVIAGNGGCEKIKGIVNNKYGIECLFEQSRYMLVKIATVSYTMILAMIHNADKRNFSESTRQQVLGYFHDDISNVEELHQCNKTVAIGDFNSSPFDLGCISSNCMHAIPFADEVAKYHTRIVQGRSFKKFYNPTWKLFGNSEPPYTTYRYDDSSNADNYYWYALDQVMVRPLLIDAFDEYALKIITHAGNHCLTKNGRPDKDNYSDHLPLFCTLKEELI